MGCRFKHRVEMVRPTHWRESYVCETGKSTKGGELAGTQKDGFGKYRIAVRIGFRDAITYVTFDRHGTAASIP
jgi:hypothetical protein